MIWKKVIAVSLLSFSFIFSSFAQEDKDQKELSEIALANNTFGWGLFKKLSKAEKKSNNLLFSPLSASLALTMLQNGAVKETETEIKQTLGYGTAATATINSGIKSLIANLLKEKTLEKVNIANALWANSDRFEFHKDFVTTADSVFKTQNDPAGTIARASSFADNKTVEDMNAWVKKNTNGMVPKIMESIESDVVAVLLNALAFEGPWENKFNEKATKPLPFVKGDGSRVEVPTMSISTHFQYAEEPDYQIVSLGFAAGKKGEGPYDQIIPGRYKLDLLISKTKDIQSFLATQDAKSYEKILAGMKLELVDLKVPKFKFKYEKVLNDTLAALGMKRVFTSSAQLDNLGKDKTGKNLAVDAVIQKTYAEMDEAGFKAAAVTAIRFVATGGAPKPKSFSAEKPFFFALRDTKTGALLFQGILSNPKF